MRKNIELPSTVLVLLFAANVVLKIPPGFNPTSSLLGLAAVHTSDGDYLRSVGDPMPPPLLIPLAIPKVAGGQSVHSSLLSPSGLSTPPMQDHYQISAYH